MTVSVESSLPRHGFGSEAWFDQVFNIANEYQKAVAILAKGFTPQSVVNWLEKEVYTLTTEWGAGREALTIQPPTNYLVKRNHQGNISLYVEKLNEFGEQLYEYQSCKDMPQAASKGLETALTMLFDLKENEGTALLSPHDFYPTSPGDVVNAFIVRKASTASNENEEELSATGWFLFTNKKLTKTERQYWLDCHNSSNQTTFDGTPEDIVSKPQYWQSNRDNSNEDSPVKAYAEWLDGAFESMFGKKLFSSNRQDSLKLTLAKRVGKEIDSLKDLLLNQEKIPFLEKLWELMKTGQKTWAEIMAVDFDWYWPQVLRGQIQIMGFHPAGDSTDPFNSTPETSLNKLFNHCKKHGHYLGEHCPKCSKQRASKS